VLDGVAALMRGNPDGGERIALVVLRREHEPFVRGVVVIAEHAFLEAQRKDLPDDFQRDAIVVRDGEDIRQALTTF